MIKKLLVLSSFLLAFSGVSMAQYCLPVYSIGCTSSDFIDNVFTTGGLTNISNLNSGCNGILPNNYTYNNTMTVSQVQGASFNYSVQAGTAFSQGFAIWIDWNQDYDFDEPNEFIWSSPGSAITPFTGSILIPTTAPPGITRMRITCRFVTVPLSTDYCGVDFSYGETEDYNVEVLPSAPCTGAPVAGTVTPGGPLTQCAGQEIHLGLTGNTVTGGLSYNWQQSTNSGGSWMNVIGGFGGTGPGYVTPNLSGSVWYQCTVTCVASGLSSTTSPLVVNVVSPSFATIPYTQDFENWVNYCDVQDVPDDFHWSNTPLTGNPSWRKYDEGYTANWLNPFDGFYLPASSTGLSSARFHSYGTNLSGDLDLYLNCSQIGNKTLTFDYINNNFTGFGFDSLEVLVSDNGGFTFNSIGSYTNAPQWQSKALIIASNTSNSILRFRGYGDFQFDTDLGIDNINVLAPCSGMPTAGIINPFSPCNNVPFNLVLSGATIAGGINYIWERAPTATGPWTNFGTTAGPIINTVVTSDTYFRCTVECPTSGLSSVTPVMFAQLATFYTCYCLSQSETNVQKQNIGNYSIYDAQNNILLNNGTAAPLLNNPSPLNYYSTFTALPPITIFRDSTFDLKVTAFTQIATFFNGYSKVYIDFNRDGIFDPVTENVGGGVLNAGTQLMTSTFQVPTTAQFGLTGMRVVYQVFGTASSVTPCGTYPSGETEDYLVNISLPPCNTPPNPGVATISDTVTCPGYILFLNDTGHDLNFLGLTFNWQYSADGISYSDIPGATSDTLSYTVNNESWFRFRTTCNGTSDGYSNILHVVMNPPFACYGQSVATGGPATDSSDVGAFVIADSTSNVNLYSYIVGGPHLNNPSAVKNRTDRTSFGAMQLFTDSVYKFAIYHIIKTPTHGDAQVSVFVDYNNNQVYDIPQERVFSGIADISNFYLFGYVRTPAFPAVNTVTGLRVVLNNDVSPNTASDTGVGLYESGETEDYLVTFKYKQLPDNVKDIYAIENIGVYPNPTSGKIYIGLTSVEATPLSIQTLSITGAILAEKKFENVHGEFITELDLANYAKGSYLIKIISNRGNFIRRVVVE